MRAIKIILILFFISAFSLISKSQNLVYVSTQDGSIYLVDLSDCSSQFIINVGVNGGFLSDIALHPTTGILYGVRSVNRFLVSVDLSNLGVTEISQLNPNFNALTFSKDGVLYGASGGSDNVYTINTTTGQVTTIGSTGTNITSAGDLTFSGGMLYLSGNINTLVEIDTADFSNSRIVGTYTNAGNFGILGVTSDFILCESKMYSFSGNDIFELSASSEFLEGTLLCDDVFPGFVAGAASVAEAVDTFRFNLGEDLTLCPFDSLALGVIVPNSTYLWQDNSTDSIFLVTEQGEYFVEINTPCGINSDTVNIDYVEFPEITGIDTLLCDGDQLTLNVTTPNATYLWHDNSTDPNFTITQAGQYFVEITSSGCTRRDTSNIVYNSIPIVNLGEEIILCTESEGLVLDATNPNATYLWQDNSTDSIFIVTQEGQYSVQVTTLCGTDMDTVNITLEECNCLIFRPNAFTPNADGTNDVFSIISNCNFVEYNLVIFNRWGETIAEISDPNEFWNGTYNGNELSNGTFTYLLTYKFENSESETVNGDIHLIR